MPVPAQPKIYHIVHVDRLPSIVANGLWSDAQVIQRSLPGTTTGMNGIKQRRLQELTLQSHPGLHVGACVPFYFCPRSIMLYLIDRANHPELEYRGGQEPVVHLESDLNEAVDWANANRRRWAFTLSNAGSRYFEDRSDLSLLKEINWAAVQAKKWQSCKDDKQAEFLVETDFPWKLVESVGVYNKSTYHQAARAIRACDHKPALAIKPGWYY